ncbi:MAG TPA: trehalose-phosphatase [Candidatus Limnocylindrales bacterium]
MTAAGAAWAEARRRALDLVAAPPPLLVVSDFDGTLAPISPDPMGAAIEPIARRAIRRLARLAAERPERVVVVLLSGRTAEDLAGRVRIGGVGYLGNHGVETGRLGRAGRAVGRARLTVEVDPDLERWVAPATAVGDAVASRLGNPDWLFVERKGSSVAFHFRAARDVDAARLAVLEAIESAERAAGGTGLARLEGRRIVELRPEIAGGKGSAVERLIARVGPGAVLAMGDDRSDAEAFAIVARERAAGRLAGLTVAVHAAAETPTEVKETADVELATPRDAARLLSSVAGALEREGRRSGAIGATRSRSRPGGGGRGTGPGRATAAS